MKLGFLRVTASLVIDPIHAQVRGYAVVLNPGHYDRLDLRTRNQK